MSRPVPRVRPAVESLDARVVLSTIRPFTLATATPARVVVRQAPQALSPTPALVATAPGGSARAVVALGPRAASTASLGAIARRLAPNTPRAASAALASSAATAASVRVVRPATAGNLAAGAITTPAGVMTFQPAVLNLRPATVTAARLVR